MKLKALVRVLALWLGIATFAAAQTSGAAPTAPAAPAEAPTPRIVVQASHAAGFDVAGFTPDGRYLVTASGIARELLLWDVAQLHLVDRLRLPSPAGKSNHFILLNRMEVAADGRSLRIDGEVLDPTVPGLRAPRTWAFDLAARRFSFPAPGVLPPLPPRQTWVSLVQRRIGALSVQHAGGADMSAAEAARVLPALPRAPDGRQLVRANPSWALVAADGSRVSPPTPRLVSIEDADLTADDRLIALLHTNMDARTDTSVIDVMELATGRHLPAVTLNGTYDRVRWIGNGQYVALPQDAEDDPKDGGARGAPPPVVRVEAATGRILASHPARCFMALLPGGALVGGGLGNCRRGAGSDTALQRLTDAGWEVLPGFEMPRGAHIRIIAASPDGRRLFVATRLADGTLALEIADPRTGDVAVLAGIDDKVEATMAGFSDDGRRVWMAINGTIREWSWDQKTAADEFVFRDFPVTTLLPSRFATRGNRLMIGGFIEERIQLIDLAKGEVLRPVGFPGAAALGYMKTRPFMWAVSTIEGLRIWDARSGRIILTTAFLPGQKTVTVAPDGRYDTNLGPDSESFRWLISDRPFQSLAPQTLMRDHYLPQLATKLLDCTFARSCPSVLKPLPPLASLNRRLPQLDITAIDPADTPGRLVVTVEARETRDAAGRSGLFGLKLLLNNRQLADDPPHFQQPLRPGLAEWRTANRLQTNANGVWRGRFEVPVPTHHDGQTFEFSAYAFNEDRVKSNTARRSIAPPPMPPRPRRAFVITIGVDDYVESRLALTYAVADARLIAQRLAQIPGYEMHHISLTTTRGADGRPQRLVTRSDIRGLLSLLSGFPPEMPDMIRLQDVHGIRNLPATTPDDIVILSFSGHGHADATGQFALVPSDARWPLNGDPQNVVTAEALTVWLGFMQAAEIAFIIDACHSGAAVDTPDFKPGPMGDASLGQLAFDKGLRILAATQANDPAMENALLGHGFLTAALGQGLPPAGNLPADLNKDGRVGLDEWLRFAVERLPTLNAETRGGTAQVARGVLLEMTGPAVEARLQQPSLFDFNPAPSPVVLRAAR